MPLLPSLCSTLFHSKFKYSLQFVCNAIRRWQLNCKFSCRRSRCLPMSVVPSRRPGTHLVLRFGLVENLCCHRRRRRWLYSEARVQGLISVMRLRLWRSACPSVCIFPVAHPLARLQAHACPPARCSGMQGAAQLSCHMHSSCSLALSNDLRQSDNGTAIVG